MSDATEHDPLEEVIEHYLAEKPADFEAFLARHPEHADELRELLPALEKLDERGRALAAGLGEDGRQEQERGPAGDDFVARVLADLEAQGVSSRRYARECEIARGGQGLVVAVRDPTLNRTLAMKVALASSRGGSERATSDPRSLGRFLEEARVTAQLDHPGIVPVHELGLDPEKRVYFTMKLVKGRDLRRILELVQTGEEGWTQTRSLSVLLKVCEAMAYAHSKGVIHRDLKPSNVMVGKFGEVYVMDWGLARVLGAEDRRDIRIRPEPTSALSFARSAVGDDLGSPLVTMDGDVMGTPSFMPPEQARGELAAMGAHSDVYAVGAMLYQLLTGQMPYLGDGSRLSNREVLVRVQHGPPEPVQALAPSVPAELVAICEKAMAREVAARYHDMGGLAEDLRAYLEHRVVRAYEAGPIAELRKWMGRNRTLAGVGALGLLALVGGMVSSLVLKRASDSNARQAAAERASVMQLSVFQELSELEKLADGLWPAVPRNIPAYRDWLQRARALVAGLDPDPASGDAGHLARLAQLRARAQPYSDEGREADRRSHPSFGELVRVQGKLADLERAQAIREGKASVEEVALESGQAALDAGTLNELGWRRVGPAGSIIGETALGLAYTRAAMQQASTPSDHANFLDTLAWALLANGLDEEARAASEDALHAAPEEQKEKFQGYLARIQAEVEAARSGETRARLERERAALEGEVGARRTLQFEAREDRWWHAQIVELVAALRSLGDPNSGLIEGTAPEHGWGIARRLARAKGDRGRERGRDRDRSQVARGNRLDRGRDPVSRLWRARHRATGRSPADRPRSTLGVVGVRPRG